MDLDLLRLRCFVTVAEELHFGRAALRLGLSQPQVSRHVRGLEGQLGVILFVRSARHTSLTDAGAILLDDARETLAAAQRLQTRAALAGRAGSGRVGVGFVASTLVAYLAPLVAAAAEHHHEIELAVSQQHVVEIVPALRRGDVDLVISRPLFEDSEMIETTLRHEPTVLAIPEDHRFSAQETVRLAQLQGEPVIALHREIAPAAYDAVMAWLADHGIELEIVQHVRSAAEALALVSAGIGVHRLPISAAPPAHPGLVYREIEDSRSRVVLTRRPEPPTPAVSAIARLARTLFDDASDASKNGTSDLEQRHLTAYRASA